MSDANSDGLYCTVEHYKEDGATVTVRGEDLLRCWAVLRIASSSEQQQIN